MLDWQQFTPWQSLIGGALLGLSAGMFVLLNGRIAGISGMLGSLFEWNKQNIEKLCFLVGVLIAPVLYVLFQPTPVIQFNNPIWQILVAGLLVGIGTYLASGCTSGHGICGLSRLSPRSLVSVLCFMAAGVLSVFLLRHVWGN